MDNILSNPIMWGIDPLFHTHVKLLSCMLHYMIPAQHPYASSMAFYIFPGSPHPRPIRLVHIAGLVVFVTHHDKFTRFLVDDGTGTARCIIWAASDAPSTDFALGHYVQVRAMLEWYNKVPVLVVTWLRSDKDPHAELVWFVEVHQVHNRVYSAGYSPKVIQASQSVASQQFSSK